MGLYKIDKQLPASLPQICAPRLELMRIFDKAALNQYIYVHAPAGYGKTISTLLWLKKTEKKTIWISLDTYDNTPLLFYRLLSLSFMSQFPHDTEMQHRVRSAHFGSAPVENTIDLITRFSYDDAPYALVLDDFHLITNEEILKSLHYVVKRLPENVTVIMISRNSFAETFSFVSDEGRLSIIDSKALTFSRDEIKKHFAGFGRFITKDEAEQIYRSTEGWGIALNAIASSGNLDLPVSGTDFLSAYIEKNIWNKLNAVVQLFLMKTAVPDKFTLELCQYLTEDTKSEAMLNGLMGSNISISCIGEEYRYHNLFLEFLRGKLDQSELDNAVLNRRAAEYFLTRGDFLNAKSYAIKSRDIMCIGRCVRSFYNLKMFSIDEYIDFHKLHGIYAIPEAISEKSPLMYAPLIFFRYAGGDAVSTGRYFDKLYALMPKIAQAHPEDYGHIKGMIMMDSRVPLSELEHVSNRLPPVSMDGGEMRAPTFTLQLPFLHRSIREFHEIMDPDVYNKAYDFSVGVIGKNVDVMFRSAKAGLLMEKGAVQEAASIISELKERLTDEMSPEFVYTVFMMEAELQHLAGRKAGYEEALRDIDACISQHGGQYLQKNVAAYKARVEIENGDQTQAEQWLRNYYVDDHSFGELHKIYRNFTTVRAYILLGQFDKALIALKQLRHLGESFNRPMDTIEADVLRAITEWQTGKKKEARTRLQNTLAMMHKFGYIRLVANEGKAVLPILSAIVKRLEKGDGPFDELMKFTKEVYLASYEQAKNKKGIAALYEQSREVHLSPQQKRILEMLSKGYRNADIVAETGLSLNTVRTHTKLTYRKLEVNTAEDAVTHARQLGIID